MKNKRKALYVYLSAALITLSAGCAKPEPDRTQQQTKAPAQTESQAEPPAVTQAQSAETTSSEQQPEENQNPMQTILQALAATTGDNGLHYNSSDPVFVWTALSHAAQADNLKNPVSEDTLKNYLHSFFEGVEDLPPVDTSVKDLVSYDEASKSYTFPPSPAPAGALILSDPEDLEDGSYKIKGEYMAKDGLAKLSGWFFFVKPSDGPYPYVVQYMENEDYLCSDIYEELQSLTAADPTSPQ